MTRLGGGIVRWLVAAAIAAVAAVGWWYFAGEPRGISEPGIVEKMREGGPLPFQSLDPGAATRSPPAWFGQANAPPAAIAGVVLFRGRPLEGAWVELSSDLTGARFHPRPRVRTDRAGRFDFGPKPAARYTATAGRPGTVAATVHFDTRDPLMEPPSIELRIALRECEIRLRGVVRDVSGGVISGAEIRQVINGPPMGTTDGEGRYEVCATRGGLTIEVSASGYAREQRQVAAFGPLSVDFDLVPEAIFRGQVVRADTGEPLSDVLLEAWPPGLSGRFTA